jgi:chemotaxis methyl-accepting protein methylase
MLEPSGYLILGSGESMMGLSDDFEPTNVDGAILYKKKTAKPQVFGRTG